MRMYDIFCPECGIPTEIEEDSSVVCKKCKLTIVIEKRERCNGCKVTTIKCISSSVKELNNNELLYKLLNKSDYEDYDLKKEILRRMDKDKYE